MQLDKLRSIENVDVAGKRVLVRADINVPMSDGQVSDATRIERVLPTIRKLVDGGAKVIIMSHLGRPKGEFKPEFSLAPVAAKLGSMLNGTNVKFAEDCIGSSVQTAADGLADGDVMMLENLRYHAAEEKNDPDFARDLSAVGDIYVNDAFSCAHRAHASTEAIAHLLPSYAGLALMKEVDALRTALEKPERPVAAVIGGAKVSTKIPVLTNVASKVDMMIIGGGMANTFLHAGGINVGNSLCEPDSADTVTAITDGAAAASCEIVLPTDVVVAEAFQEGAASEVVPVDAVPSDRMILDVGPETVSDLIARLKTCKTVLWNGPLGAFEIAPFGEGTFAVAREAARLSREGSLVTIAGGGDTVAALNAAGLTGDFTYVSTAGGAFLEWLEGRELPGIVALTQANG